MKKQAELKLVREYTFKPTSFTREKQAAMHAAEEVLRANLNIKSIEYDESHFGQVGFHIELWQTISFHLPNAAPKSAQLTYFVNLTRDLGDEIDRIKNDVQVWRDFENKLYRDC